MTPLMLAMENSHIEICQFFLETIGDKIESQYNVSI